MKSLNRSDFRPYTDVYTKYCPYCGVEFYTNRNADVFSTKTCYQQYYGLRQRCERAQTLACFQLPIQREWTLRTREKIHLYLLDLIRVSEYMWILQNVPVMSEFMQIIGMKTIDLPDEDYFKDALFIPTEEMLRIEISEDLKGIINYPPAFEEPLVTIDTMLQYLLRC